MSLTDLTPLPLREGVPAAPSLVATRAIRVVIADGQPVVRAGLRALLAEEHDIAVVAEAADAGEVTALARRLSPDVVLLDADLPGTDVLEATRRIAGPDQAGPHVIILAARECDEWLFAALRAGASGFLVKSVAPADLVEAVRVVAADGALLSPGATRRLIVEFASQPPRRLPSDVQLDEVTPRERQVVALVAAGMSNDEIAEQLVISRATAKTHVSSVLRKLDVRDRAQLVAVAYHLGLVRPRPAARLHAVPAGPRALGAA
jgi:DNA-binding NarL/FixJ family response regulator